MDPNNSGEGMTIPVNWAYYLNLLILAGIYIAELNKNHIKIVAT
jgi:hypothetical protein